MSEQAFLKEGRDGKLRCAWCGDDPLYQKYHDEEWGKLITADLPLFEFLILESFQAGLSWLTVLRKRENFREAFHGFDYRKVAEMGEREVEMLMQNPGIIRNRLKIQAAIHNARCFQEVLKEFGSFDAYLRSILGNSVQHHFPKTRNDLPASTPVSDRLSLDMGKRGFKFRGTTICYAFLQATGRIDDHIVGCWKKP